MQVDQTFKRPFLTGAEQPVDGACLVGLEVGFKELGREITADGLARSLAPLLGWLDGIQAQAVGDKLQVFFQGVGAPDGTHKLFDAGGNIILKPVLAGQWQNAIAIGGSRR